MTDNRAYGATGDEKPPPAYYPDTNDGQITAYENVAPPSYAQTQNEAPPPSYDSIFGEIRAAQRNAEGRGHFLKSVCAILLNTTAFTISICILFAIPVLMIIVGALNLNNCRTERMIPVWLVIAGSAASLSQLMSLFKRLKKKCKGTGNEEESSASEEEPCPGYNCCSGILGCFNLAWFFAGNVWVYRNYPPNTDDSFATDYCDRTTYYLSFWLITSVYIIIFCFCCCSCCLASCAVGGSGSSSNNNS